MPVDHAWLSLLWLLICVVAIVGLAYWFTKYVVGRGALGGLGGLGSTGGEHFKVLARLSLGREQAVVLLRVGERHFLLGVTPSAVSTLAELTQEEAQACSEASEQAVGPGFGETLRTMLQQKKRR